jgi:hypothetical protein
MPAPARFGRGRTPPASARGFSCHCGFVIGPGNSGALHQFDSARSTLFGSWPVITLDRWLADFAKLGIRDEIQSKVLKANARKLLNL